MPHFESSLEDRMDSTWRQLLRISAICCIVMFILILVQIGVFVIWPPPAKICDWFALFQKNGLLGLLSLDVLYIVNNTLLIPIYISLYLMLKKGYESWMTLSLVLGLVGIAAYYASNPAFEMLSLSRQYFAAASDAQTNVFLAAGEALLVSYKGTSFIAYYVLNDIMLLIMSAVLLRSRVLGRPIAYTALLSGLLMTIPSSFGTLGMIFSISSLVPWAVFILLVAKKLLKFTKPSRFNEISFD